MDGMARRFSSLALLEFSKQSTLANGSKNVKAIYFANRSPYFLVESNGRLRCASVVLTAVSHATLQPHETLIEAYMGSLASAQDEHSSRKRSIDTLCDAEGAFTTARNLAGICRFGRRISFEIYKLRHLDSSLVYDRL
jgi:hypothetical protein